MSACNSSKIWGCAKRPPNPSDEEIRATIVEPVSMFLAAYGAEGGSGA